MASSPTSGGRIYKSRKSRPCDSCRRRKVTCDMPCGPPCRRCAQKDGDCTFEEGPGPRKRPNRANFQHSTKSGHDLRVWTEDANSLIFSPTTHQLFLDNFQDPPYALRGSTPGSGSFTFEHFGLFQDPFQFTEELGHDQRPLGTPSKERTRSEPSPGAASKPSSEQGRTDSLEFLPDSFSFYIGPTGVSDVHLLRREAYDDRDLTKPKVSGLKYRRLQAPHSASDSSTAETTIFGITEKALVDRAEPRLDPEVIDAAWSDLWKLLSPTAAWRLIQLYGRFVDPYFPILSKHQIPGSPDELSNMSLALLTAICATALPFMMYDETLVPLLLRPPSSQQLYRLCWLGISQELHTPSLATVQSCLLLLQRLPTNYYLSDTAYTWSLISSAVAAGQTIGLHRDPSSWKTVPLWEQRLRKRLWWALWTMEKWIALARGMPSHLHDDDSDVEPLMSDDIDDTLSNTTTTKTHLCYLTALTNILSDIQNTYYSVRGIRRTAKDLQYSLDVARSIRVRLKEWRDQLPSTMKFGSIRDPGTTPSPQSSPHSSEPDLDGNASIHLSYIVTHMSLFRALLRPLDDLSSMLIDAADETRARYEGAKAVTRGALLCVKEFVEFVETLTGVQWNAFWHSWARAGFAIAGSFMVHLLHIITLSTEQLADDYSFEEERADLLGLVKRWRWANRVAANGAAGMKGLTNLGLLRVETLLNNFTETDK